MYLRGLDETTGAHNRRGISKVSKVVSEIIFHYIRSRDLGWYRGGTVKSDVETAKDRKKRSNRVVVDRDIYETIELAHVNI